MKTQLLHILTMTMRRYITVRVVPVAVGAHAGAAGSFLQLKYDKFEPVVFVEGGRTGLFLEDKGSLVYYDEVLKALDRSALNEGQSRELITSIVS